MNAMRDYVDNLWKLVPSIRMWCLFMPLWVDHHRPIHREVCLPVRTLHKGQLDKLPQELPHLQEPPEVCKWQDFHPKQPHKCIILQLRQQCNSSNNSSNNSSSSNNNNNNNNNKIWLIQCKGKQKTTLIRITTLLLLLVMVMTMMVVDTTRHIIQKIVQLEYDRNLMHEYENHHHHHQHCRLLQPYKKESPCLYPIYHLQDHLKKYDGLNCSNRDMAIFIIKMK
mmetsp:Transcript_26756/g.37599  ORF Transcript_26756/g.37599 Transcript_26756/m.37599 type:complete len:224 (-) Transcript_26756:1655-2326(-)